MERQQYALHFCHHILTYMQESLKIKDDGKIFEVANVRDTLSRRDTYKAAGAAIPCRDLIAEAWMDIGEKDDLEASGDLSIGAGAGAGRSDHLAQGMSLLKLRF